MGPAVLSIYTPEGTTVRNNISANAPNENGMYTLTLPNTGFEAGYVYPATLTILYRGRDYPSTANIDVGSEILQYEFFTKTATQLASSVAQMEEAVGEGTSAMLTKIDDTEVALETATEDAAEEIMEELTSATTEMAADLDETSQNLQTSLDSAESELQTTMQAKILNRDKEVKAGKDLIVRYKTYTGLVPKIDVYDSRNVQRVIKGTMLEMGVTGIYEYKIKVLSLWGLGDMTIVCSEETYGTLDALNIMVVRSTVEDIAGQTSAILGSTSSLSDLGNITSVLNTP